MKINIVGGAALIVSLTLASLACLEFTVGDSNDTTWAVLVAGSRGYENYRHQADVCHAYQLLREGGIQDENIIVFMYNDVAFADENPRKGVLINTPDGPNVYHGVPKDYTGEDVNVKNLFAVILGNKSATTGGSGKVLRTGPDDHIFIYYSGHGGPGVLGMPTNPHVFADDLVNVLTEKHTLKTYKSLVIYLDSCESGSLFEGLLSQDLNIYATTATDAYHCNYVTYCPGIFPNAAPEDYETCLGNFFSISWMEESKEIAGTLREQMELIKEKTFPLASRVEQYGNLRLNRNKLSTYFGKYPPNANFSSGKNKFLRSWSALGFVEDAQVVNQRDASLHHFWAKYLFAQDFDRKTKAHRDFVDLLGHGMYLENCFEFIGKLIFGMKKGPEVLKTVRPSGEPLVDDWTCLKTLVRTLEVHCGSLSQHGMKYMRSIANICNSKVPVDQVFVAIKQTCAAFPPNPWSSLSTGFSA